MAAYGLTQADIDEGWDLLKSTSRVRGSRQAEYTASPTVVANADAWENRWFPIIDASLARRFPDIHATVFNNLSQTEGPPVLLGISLRLERLAELEKATAKTSRDARALLKDRGVTKAVLDEAKGYLTEATIPAEETVIPAEEINAAIEEAETNLWAWYLEWSKIARVASTTSSGSSIRRANHPTHRRAHATFDARGSSLALAWPLGEALGFRAAPCEGEVAPQRGSNDERLPDPREIETCGDASLGPAHGLGGASQDPSPRS